MTTIAEPAVAAATATSILCFTAANYYFDDDNGHGGDGEEEDGDDEEEQEDDDEEEEEEEQEEKEEEQEEKEEEEEEQEEEEDDQKEEVPASSKKAAAPPRPPRPPPPTPAALKDRVLRVASECAAASRPLVSVEACDDALTRQLGPPHMAALVEAAALAQSITCLDLSLATTDLLLALLDALHVQVHATALKSLQISLPSLSHFAAVPPSAPILPSITRLVLAADNAPKPAANVPLALGAVLAHFPETRYLQTYFGSANQSVWGPAALDTVAARCPRLAHLDTRGTGGYASADIDRFMTRMPHLSALRMELTFTKASAAWAADEIADAAWWAQIERLSIIPNCEVGFFYPAEHAVAIVSRLRGGLKWLSVGVNSACVVAVAEAVLHCAAAASVESIRLVWASLAEENARKAVELIIASKPPNLKSLVCSTNVKDEDDPEYRKIVALATSAGISLANNVMGGLPKLVFEEL